MTADSRRNVVLHAGTVGWFEFGEAWFHLDLRALQEGDFPIFLAACHEDAHRVTQSMRFGLFQQFLGFSELAAAHANARHVTAHVVELQAAAIAGSVHVQEGLATVQMLLNCAPNYTRHFARFHEFFSTLEPYATGLRLYESVLGPLPALFENAKNDASLRASIEGAATSLAEVAMGSDVLRRFRDFDRLSLADWRTYVELEGPDARLKQLAPILSSRFEDGGFLALYMTLARELAPNHRTTPEGSFGSEGGVDDFALALRTSLMRALEDQDGGLPFKVHHSQADDVESHFFPQWFASLDRMFAVDRGLRAAWLESNFVAGIFIDATGESRVPGLGRMFRIAMPTEWVAFDHLDDCRDSDGQPHVWSMIVLAAQYADDMGWLTAIGFLSTDVEGEGAVVITLWDNWQISPCQMQATMAFKLDASIVERPQEPRPKEKVPWLIYTDGYLAGEPLIRGFIRPGDVTFATSAALNTFDVARSLDDCVAKGRAPVLVPHALPFIVGHDRSEHLYPWVVSSCQYPEWRWVVYPACLDALKFVLFERSTLTREEGARRCAALDMAIRMLDALGPLPATYGTKEANAAAAVLAGALDQVPEEEQEAVKVIHKVGFGIALHPSDLLGAGAVPIRQRIRRHRGERLALVENYFRSWLEPPAERVAMDGHEGGSSSEDR